MSFRGRLTLFFLLIVVLPMIAVAVLVVDVTGDSRSGKADARLAAGLEAAIATYSEERAQAERVARKMATDPALGSGLLSGQRGRVEAEARRLARSFEVESLVVAGPGGRTLASVGPARPVGAAELEVALQGSGRELGTLSVSLTGPTAFLLEARRLTGRDAALLANGDVVSSTLGIEGLELPASGKSADVEVGGETLRVAASDLPGSGGLRLALFVPEDEGGFLASSPLIAIALGIFFAIALLFIGMLLRALQGQVGAMLGAARRIGSGDFSREVPVVGNDEMAGLASEFNKMSDRLSEQMEALRRQRTELEHSVRRIGEAFASGLDRQALLEIVAETALTACDAEYGLIALRGAAAAEAEAGEASPEMQEAALAAEERAMREGSGVEATHEDAHALASPLPRIGTPGETLGVMTVARRGEPFGPAERDVFLYLVGQASASAENIALHDLVTEQAVTDELTGLANNRAFRELIRKEGARAERFGHDLSLVMLDIDDFKQVNDTHGHLQGDEVLRAIGLILRSESRGVDEPARYGGEEFVVALPETDVAGAVELGERIRARIESQEVRRLDGKGVVRVTASVGAASMPASAADVEGLVAAADAALYRAKGTGKNRVERAPDVRGDGVPATAPERPRRHKAAARED